MEFVTLMHKRRMVRSFLDQPIDPAMIERILDLARRAPSAGYTQGQSFVVVQDEAKRKSIAALAHEEEYVQGGYGHFISQAPVLVIPCTSEAAYHRRYQEADKILEDGSEIVWPVPFWYMDIGASIMALLLAVVDEGLGAAFVGVHDLQALRRLLEIPQEVTPMGAIAVGHPAVDKRSTSLKRGRKPLESVVHWNKW
ncbi:MAG: nitroreductase family protein [Anaerolineales bacterium]|jgi:nitroreductase